MTDNASPTPYSDALKAAGTWTRYADVTSIAAELGLSRPLVYTAIERGDLETEQTPSGFHVIRTSDVDHWIADRRRRGLK